MEWRVGGPGRVLDPPCFHVHTSLRLCPPLTNHSGAETLPPPTPALSGAETLPSPHTLALSDQRC